MIEINKSTPQKIQVKCYVCRTVMEVSPMANMDSPYLTDCNLHKCICKHESDGRFIIKGPLGGEVCMLQCNKCEEFY